MRVTAAKPAPVADIEAFITQDEEKDLLRLSTAGSVDDGKSTLIGRLLYDSNGVYEDQLASVRQAVNRSTNPFDLALLTDGLRAEREQGITIDVAYRYFATSRASARLPVSGASLALEYATRFQHRFCGHEAVVIGRWVSRCRSPRKRKYQSWTTSYPWCVH